MKKNIPNALKNLAVMPWLVAALCGGMAASPAFAQTKNTFYGSDDCKELIYQGQELQTQSKGTEALAKFKAAASQCPAASSPLSSLGGLYLDASRRTAPQNVKQYRQLAENYARAALAIESRDPVALETLRALKDSQAGLAHQPAPEAMRALAEAEKLFAARKFDEAYKGYMEAQKLDPQWASPWVYAGDCLFQQKKIAEAAELYRKGTQVDPYFVQSWRFLAHALILQGKLDEARQALIGAISAQPNYMPAWENLADLAARSGKPMTALKFKPRASTVTDKDTGKSKIVMDEDLTKSNGDGAALDSVAWMTYAMAKAVSNEKSKSEEEKSPFRQEYDAWNSVFTVLDEASAKNSSKLTDPQLLMLSDFRKNKQLDAALLLLTYREAYRADFEEWKKNHPDGIINFIDSFNVRP